MADDRVVDDEIVTKFLLDTCRLRQLSVLQVHAAELCAEMPRRHPNKDDKIVYITLTTGSTVEFYIQPMLSCVGDIDIMFHRNNQLAIPAGHSPPPAQLPDEFYGRVKVYEIIDSGYSGYVYLLLSHLLTENIDRHDSVQFNRCQYLSHERFGTAFEINGPAVTAYHKRTGRSLDDVYCIRCLSWPIQASDWPTRHRSYGWPDSATVDCVVSNGCDMVQVAHRLCRHDYWMNTHQYRLSFSRAEIVLLNSWMPLQQIVYHVLRFFVKTERLTDITVSTGTKMLTIYHIKTLMLWACELKPRSWWIDDLNVIRNCVALLHSLADWMKNENYPHYFIKNCNLNERTIHVEVIAGQLLSITQSWLSTWFVNSYIRKCARLCPDRVSRLSDDDSTSMKLQNAVSAVVHWRLNSALHDLRSECHKIEFCIMCAFYGCNFNVLTARSWINQLPKIDSSLCVYFAAVAFLHVMYKATRNGMNDELIDVLATVVGHYVGKQRYSNQLSSALSLSQAVKFMKVAVNNSRSTARLMEIELSKAYLYRALRFKDSDSDSIYCLANVYLAVLYYTTGHYRTTIRHCALVMRPQYHSQCSSHVIKGELLPKIDDDIDSVLGLAVFYQYVRGAASNQQQQTHVSVFTTKLFARYLHIRCLSVMKYRQFSQYMPLAEEVQQYIKFVFHFTQLRTADVLFLKLTQMFARKYHRMPVIGYPQNLETDPTELDTSELVELLQKSAVEHLTKYRQLQGQKFGRVATIVTADFEAMYAYKRGNYLQCLRLSTQNVRTLLYGGYTPDIPTFPEFIQLMDDEIVSLSALVLLVNPNCRRDSRYCMISQLTMSLYLMTQCQLRLHRSMMSLAQTLGCIDRAKSKESQPAVSRTLEHLILKLIERKLIIYLSWIMF